MLPLLHTSTIWSSSNREEREKLESYTVRLKNKPIETERGRGREIQRETDREKETGVSKITRQEWLFQTV